ncbi:15746_t:CDS:2, partial [Racocetra fulgida]
ILKGDHATEKNRLKYVKDVLKKLVEAAHKNSKPETKLETVFLVRNEYGIAEGLCCVDHRQS